MASVNWTLYESDRTPVPLPQEKFLFEARKVTLLLFPSVPGAPLNQQSKDKSKERQADGTIYASNQRICFVASSQQSSSTSFFSFAKTSSSEGTKLESLSVPYAAFTDSRFVQPTFSASYIDALVLPSAEGGLDGPHIARISFYEGGAADFYSVVTECKARLGDTASNIAEPESLRASCLCFIDQHADVRISTVCTTRRSRSESERLCVRSCRRCSRM